MTTMELLQVARDMFDSGRVATSYRVMDEAQPDYAYLGCTLRKRVPWWFDATFVPEWLTWENTRAQRRSVRGERPIAVRWLGPVSTRTLRTLRAFRVPREIRLSGEETLQEIGETTWIVSRAT